MGIDRGIWGAIPWAAIGAGRDVVFLPGLSPIAGRASDGFVRTSLRPVRGMADHRRLILLNRWAGLPAGLTMASLAGAYASAVRTYLQGPVDVVGLSTGGSIAQQWAADHPDTVRRLVLVSTAARLAGLGKAEQLRMAELLRAGAVRAAAGFAASDLAPRGLRTAARGIGWAAGRRIITSDRAAQDLIATIDAEDGFDLARCAAPVRAPTLIVAGGRDRFYERSLFEETAALIPGSRLRISPTRGHITVTWDKRAMDDVTAFLDADA